MGRGHWEEGDSERGRVTDYPLMKRGDRGSVTAGEECLQMKRGDRRGGGPRRRGDSKGGE